MNPTSRTLLGVRVDVLNYASATSRIVAWARAAESRVVCCASVHSLMEAFDHPDFRTLLNSADLVSSDGMPLVWLQRRLGARDATRVYGPDLMRAVLAEAERCGLSVGLLGGRPQTLARLVEVIRQTHPRLSVDYAWSPPFGPPETAAEQRAIDDLNHSGVRILFVGLGCPKQERWMADHRTRLHVVSLGVGAAFDFLAGHVAEAPRWMQHAGLEWLFRLLREPRRLWRRYLILNPRFVLHAAADLWRARQRSSQ